MAVQSETVAFGMEPVASVSTESVNSLEGKEFKENVLDSLPYTQNMQALQYAVNAKSIGIIYAHHCVGRPLKKAALTVLKSVLEKAVVVKPWRKGHNKKQQTGMVAAPILIDGIKYLCGVTLQKNANRQIIPIAIVIKDKDGNVVEEKVIDNISVPDNSNGNSNVGTNHCGDAAITSQDANQPFQIASLQQISQTNKQNNENKQYSNMNKNRIRLTESQLHRIIKESVKNIVNEQNNTILIQILTTSINVLQKYVSAGQYQQALKVSQVITAKINALINQASQQQMQQNQQPAQQAQQYQRNALG